MGYRATGLKSPFGNSTWPGGGDQVLVPLDRTGSGGGDPELVPLKALDLEEVALYWFPY